MVDVCDPEPTADDDFEARRWTGLIGVDVDCLETLAESEDCTGVMADECVEVVLHSGDVSVVVNERRTSASTSKPPWKARVSLIGDVVLTCETGDLVVVTGDLVGVAPARNPCW